MTKRNKKHSAESIDQITFLADQAHQRVSLTAELEFFGVDGETGKLTLKDTKTGKVYFAKVGFFENVKDAIFLCFKDR
jgi:hypothetical protein